MHDGERSPLGGTRQPSLNISPLSSYALSGGGASASAAGCSAPARWTAAAPWILVPDATGIRGTVTNRARPASTAHEVRAPPSASERRGRAERSSSGAADAPPGDGSPPSED